MTTSVTVIAAAEDVRSAGSTELMDELTAELAALAALRRAARHSDGGCDLRRER